MRKIIFTFLIFPNLFASSQSPFNSESFRVTLSDIETNTFEKDSTANAIVIYEGGNSYVDPSEYDLRTEVKRKIKILKREGFDKATITIYLYNNKSSAERVEDIFATTYNKIDGEVIKTQLEKTAVFNEKYDDNHTIVKFTLPNVKEGSVITYSYKLKSRFMFNYKGWDFQDDIPKIYSEYKTSIPANWIYNIKLIGFKPLDISTSALKKNCLEGSGGATADCSINHYAMKDIPAFIEEDYMTHKSNYLARIEYELQTFQGFDGVVNDYSKTWKTVDSELKSEPSIGRQLSKSLNDKDFLNETIINEVNILKKAQNIYKYVQDHYTWDGEFEIFQGHTVKDLIKNKSGNVSSINIFLHNLLEACEIDVKPVLLSTRNNGFPTKLFPVISGFNYLIVQATIDNKTYLLDATDDFLSFGEIPFRCLNSYGRLLDFKNGSQWIDFKPTKRSTVQYKVDLKIDNKNGTMAGTIDARKAGYHAHHVKKAYYSNSASYIENLQDKFPIGEISNHSVKSEDKTSYDFYEVYDIEYQMEMTTNNIYLNPFYIKFFKENPFKLQERTYPIDFGYEDTYNYLFDLNVGDNYAIIEKPTDIVLRLPNKKGQLFFSSKIIDNSIKMQFTVTFKEAIYGTEYYPYLKKFLSKIIDIQNNSLILLKKK
jgi:hypothetical protein